MVIGGECFPDALIVHHHERNTIGKRPIFVGTVCEQFDTACEQFMTGFDNSGLRVVLNAFQQFKVCGSHLRLGKSVSHLGQDLFRRNCATTERPNELYGLRMPLVPFVHRGKVVVAVRENGPHFFGCP